MPWCCGTSINDSEAYACCHGKTVFGPDTHVFIGSTLLILVPGAVCFGYSCYSWIPAIIGWVILIVTLYFLGRTGTTDPGYLPKQPPPTDAAVPQNRNVVETMTLEDPETGVSRQIKVERKWCHTCHLLRPPRASHCVYCNACVERMDHHCPWTGTCVGRRNHRFFVGFVWSVTILSLFVIAVCIYGMVMRQQDYVNSPPKLGPGNMTIHKVTGAPSVMEGQKSIHYFDLIFLIYSLIFLIMVGGLAGYHTYLVSANLTTHEEMKHYYTYEPQSPYHKGFWQNVKEVCCMPKGPSKVARMLRGDSSFAPVMDSRGSNSSDGNNSMMDEHHRTAGTRYSDGQPVAAGSSSGGVGRRVEVVEPPDSISMTRRGGGRGAPVDHNIGELISPPNYDYRPTIATSGDGRSVEGSFPSTTTGTATQQGSPSSVAPPTYGSPVVAAATGADGQQEQPSYLHSIERHHQLQQQHQQAPQQAHS